MEILYMVDPSWVQTGELGFAFVVLILAAGMVRYVLRTSGERERQLLQIIQDITPALQIILDALDDIDGRLVSVEKAVGVKREKRSGGRGLRLDV